MASQLDRTLLAAGNGKDYPKRGDEVTMEYTGWLHDSSKSGNKGSQYVDHIQPHAATLTDTQSGSTARSGEETSRPRSALVESFKVR